jgi:hypothetical protein
MAKKEGRMGMKIMIILIRCLLIVGDLKIFLEAWPYDT